MNNLGLGFGDRFKVPQGDSGLFKGGVGQEDRYNRAGRGAAAITAAYLEAVTVPPDQRRRPYARVVPGRLRPLVAGSSRVTTTGEGRHGMASRRQVQAAKRNVKKAQAAAKSKRTIAHLPKSTRRGLQAEARKGARRGGKAGHALEDRNRQQLYEIAKDRNIPGRSRMGKWDLIDAIRGNR